MPVHPTDLIEHLHLSEIADTVGEVAVNMGVDTWHDILVDLWDETEDARDEAVVGAIDLLASLWS